MPQATLSQAKEADMDVGPKNIQIPGFFFFKLFITNLTFTFNYINFQSFRYKIMRQMISQVKRDGNERRGEECISSMYVSQIFVFLAVIP